MMSLVVRGLSSFVLLRYTVPARVSILYSTVIASSSVVTPSNRQFPVCLSQRYLRSPWAKEWRPPEQLNMKYRAFCQFSRPPTASQSLSIRLFSIRDGVTCPFTAVVQHHKARSRFSLSLTGYCIIFIILVFQRGIYATG